jgi:hypothetical protein
MPEAALELPVSNVVVDWGSLRISGPAQLRLTSDAVEIQTAAKGTWIARYEELRGGGWRAGAMMLFGKPGSATMESPEGLDQAWALLVGRACPLPELARGHRLLGSRRGGPVDLQAKFLAPFLHGRRRLEEVADLDTRVAALDATLLRERMATALQAIAGLTYPSSAPDRRALEAELDESMSPLFRSLALMEVKARAFRDAPEALRFVAWRAWVVTVASVFAHADSSWARAAQLLPMQLKT